MLKLGEASFTTGRAKFHDQAPGSHESTAKIYVTVRFQELEGDSLAQLDTGAPWSILRSDIAEMLELLDGDGQVTTVRTHQGDVKGRLEHIPLTLVADEGLSLEVDATFLVSKEWLGGTFLGYTGMLEKIRIALDPRYNLFYFGDTE
jgi:hypothetical protein